MSVYTEYSATALNNEPSILIVPKFVRPGATGIVYCHGYGEDALEPRDLTSTRINMFNLVQALAEAGFPVISCFNAGNQWGNATAVARVTSAAAYLASRVGASSTRVGLMGQSMGHLAVMNWAAQNRAKAAFVLSSMGVADLNDIHNNSSYAASINSAYGGSYTDAAQGATYNPTVNAASKFAGLPWMCWGGSSDTVCPPAKTTALKNAIGPTASYTQVSGGHAFATVGNYDTAQIVAFAQAHA